MVSSLGVTTAGYGKAPCPAKVSEQPISTGIAPTAAASPAVGRSGERASVDVEIDRCAPQPAAHHLDRVRVLLDEHEPPPQCRCHRARRTPAGEEVQHPVT